MSVSEFHLIVIASGVRPEEVATTNNTNNAKPTFAVAETLLALTKDERYVADSQHLLLQVYDNAALAKIASLFLYYSLSMVRAWRETKAPLTGTPGMKVCNVQWNDANSHRPGAMLMTSSVALSLPVRRRSSHSWASVMLSIQAKRYRSGRFKRTLRGSRNLSR